MQIQPATVTTEITQALGANFKIMIYEQKTTVFCDCCNKQATGTKSELENRGWSFGRSVEFCTEHN